MFTTALSILNNSDFANVCIEEKNNSKIKTIVIMKRIIVCAGVR